MEAQKEPVMLSIDVFFDASRNTWLLRPISRVADDSRRNFYPHMMSV